MTQARYHTAPTPGSRTLGGKVARVAALHGTPLMPWQRLAADVTNEITDGGRWRYHTVIITVPRQSGKTTLTMGTAGHRGLIVPDGRIWYTAQTGASARERFLQDLAEPAKRALGDLVRVNRGAGDTRLTIPATGAQVRPHPPTADYLHGEQSDLNLIDEGWSYTEPQAAALMQAIEPTQATRANPQTIMLSTMGTADSTWWHRQIEEARDGKPGVAIIDYGIGDDIDPSDIPAVIDAHPAVGHTIDPSAIWKASQTLPPSEFARGYGNVASLGKSQILTDDVIAAAMTDTPIPDDARIVLAAAVSWEQQSASIVAVALVDVGGMTVPVVEVIEHRPGVSWAAPLIEQVARAQGWPDVVVDNTGPSATLHDETTARYVEVVPVAARDVTAGTEELLWRLKSTGPDGTPDPLVRFRRDDTVDRELRGAALRVMGDTGTAFSHRRSVVPIPTIAAAALGIRHLLHGESSMPAPMIWTPDESHH